MSDIERHRPPPVIIKDDKGKYRTSTGRWSMAAMADHVVKHPATMHDAKMLARVAYGDALPSHAEAARRNIRALANLLEEERNILVVVEFARRKINAIQIYVSANEYHQQLMAAEIGRRKLRSDGSADKLEHLLRSLPPASPLEEEPD
jgi:hypothetical protein